MASVKPRPLQIALPAARFMMKRQLGEPGSDVSLGSSTYREADGSAKP